MNDMEKKLTFNLIIKRNLNGVLDQGDSSNDKVEVISSLTHVRLDRENICMIDNLDALANVTNLYLQGVSFYFVLITNTSIGFNYETFYAKMKSLYKNSFFLEKNFL